MQDAARILADYGIQLPPTDESRNVLVKEIMREDAAAVEVVALRVSIGSGLDHMPCSQALVLLGAPLDGLDKKTKMTPLIAATVQRNSSLIKYRADACLQSGPCHV